MSDAPPPYPGPGGYPPPNAPYPPPQQGYPPPPQQGYPPPPQQQGFGYGEPSKAGYGAPPGQPPMQGYAPPPGQPPMQGYAPYPQQPMPQQQGHTHNTVVVTQPAITVVQTFRESPVHTNCPHCRAEVVTGIHYESGTFSWVVCCILWWIGCGLGCCLIPFCVDGCKDVVHTCPNCQQQVARWSRM